ncbi:MAG: VWA domain-containing protein [Candidatus Lokiarchaeota archaeon]|nr:VWA domain-containing protein [Candidatus Lokiarchaeota archaeon]
MNEIYRGKQKPEYYEHLSRTLGFLDVKDMTRLAMAEDNVNAVKAMLKTNLYAATSALATNEGSQFLQRQAQNTQGFALVQMFFMIRTIAPESTHNLMKNLAKKVILKTSLKISGRGLQKGMKKKRVPYYPGLAEFDLIPTMHNIMQKVTLHSIHYADIVGIKREQVKKNVVLILDTSGSMYGRSLLNAALTTSVLSYVMEKHNYAVILFNERVLFLKHMKEKQPLQKIIDDVLDAEAVGFTNIEIGLKKGLEELMAIRANRRDKFAVLVTDGNYLRGDHPAKIAREFPKLHVVGIHQKNSPYDGLDVCRKVAKAGKGKFYPVRTFHEIPRTLLNILQQH